MYLRKVTRHYKGKTYTNYVLVESVRTAKGPRQKTICSLGDLSPRPRADWLKLVHKVEDALTGQGDLLESADPEVAQVVAKVRARQAKRPAPAGETVAVDPAGVTTERHREAGPAYVGLQVWQRLGLDDILQDLGFTARTRQLTCAMTLNRLIAPAAEHAMPAWFRTTALDDLLGGELEGLSEDPLYATMDKLYPHRAAIESALVARERSLFNLEPAVYLYDLTSTYFEGAALANPKATRGYSRDKRPDCKQVVIALALGREGFPVAHEILAGNSQDHKTLAAMLDRLAERVGLKAGDTVVIDRGMAFESNLAELRQRELHYIVAARQPERDQWLADFTDLEGFEAVLRQPSPRNPAQRKTPVKVKTERRGEVTFVLCHSAARVDKDRAIRAKQEARLSADLKRLSQRIANGRLKAPAKINQAIGRLLERYPRVARYYDLAYDAERHQMTAAPDSERRDKAAHLDGCYLLKTDRTDLSADEVWRTYSLLTRVEAAFRSMKSPLAERPIFHQREHRVDTHIFLCVLAYHLLVAIENTMREGGVHTSWPTLRDTLRSHQVCTVVLPTRSGDTLRIRQSSTPEPEHREIYQTLGLSERIMAPKRSWSQPL